MNEKDFQFSPRQTVSLRLWLRLAKTAKHIERDVNGQLLRQHGHSFIRFDVLSQLYRAPEQQLSIGELGATLILPSANISRLLSRMEADGLLQRVVSTNDRRRQDVGLTDLGREQFEAMAEDQALWVEDAFSSLSDDTLDTLQLGLDKIYRDLTRQSE